MPADETPSDEFGAANVQAPDRDGETVAETGMDTSGFALGFDAPVRDPGDRLDRYIILDKLGEGGMGVVYAAYDPKLDRKIALKVLRGARSSRSLEAQDRLVAEARALARVSHPNIVTVHDVGVAGDEVFVGMELVDGRSVPAWLDESERTWNEVRELFIGVAQGLIAIHDAGLIHRDVKPENILIDRRGRVRVTDFGLARPMQGAPAVLEAGEASVVEGAVAGPRVDLTRSGMHMGTPAFMAPEQFDRSEATEQSDQFSYCVAFWTCLYQQRPFGGDSFIALMNNVVKGRLRAPPTDSRVPAWLHRVVARGLSVDPKERYPNMRALLEALEAGDPRARTRRLLTGVVSMGLLAAVAAGAFVQQRAQERRAEAACHERADELAWGEDTATELRAHFLASGAAEARDIAVRVDEELDDFAVRWRDTKLEACLAGDVHAEIDADLAQRTHECLDEQRAHFETTVDTLLEADKVLVTRSLRTVQGLPEVTSCRDAQQLARMPSRPDDPTVRAEVHELYKTLARTMVDEHVGTYEQGLTTSRAVLERAEASGYLPLIATAQYRVAVFLEKRGNYEEAVELWVEAFEAAAVAGHEELAGDAARVLAFTEGYQLARYDAGLRWAQIARVYHRRGGKLDGLQEAQRLDVMAVMLEMKGELQASLEMHRKSIALRRKVAGDRDKSVGYGLHNMAAVLESADENDAALEARREALKIFEAHFGPDNPTTLHVRFALANLQRDMGSFEDAEAGFYEVMRSWEKVLGPDHPDVGDARNALGRLRRKQGRFDEGIALHGEALAIHLAALGPDHPDTAQTRTDLAQALTATGALDEASEHFRLALDALAEADGDQSDRIGRARYGLGRIALRRGLALDALDHLRAAQTAFASAERPREGWLAKTRADLAFARALAEPATADRGRDDLRAIADHDTHDTASRARAELNLGYLEAVPAADRASRWATRARDRTAKQPELQPLHDEATALLARLNP